jgi:uncharacterized protein (TIGR01244 family)
MKQDYLQMRVLELAPQVWGSGPLFETDLGLLSKQDVRSIMYIRPDGESPGQPQSAALGKAAEEHGIAFAYFPVETRQVDKDTAAAFMKAADALKRPLLVCGRSGGHATSAWESAELATDPNVPS